jgi:hypothetical protein
MSWIALAVVVGLAFTMGSNLAFWHERKQPIDRRLMLFHGSVFVLCLTIVIADMR